MRDLKEAYCLLCGSPLEFDPRSTFGFERTAKCTFVDCMAVWTLRITAGRWHAYQVAWNLPIDVQRQRIIDDLEEATRTLDAVDTAINSADQ